MTYDAILFDFDGVLADSEALHWEAFRQVLATEGQPLSKEEYFAQLVHFDDRNVFRAVSTGRKLGWDETRIEALVARKSRAYFGLLSDHDILYPGAAALVKRLSKQVPLAICSMAARDEIEQILNRGGVRNCFAALITADDVHRPKPDPEPYLLCLARLNDGRAAAGSAEPQLGNGGNLPSRESALPGYVAARCLVVEDTCGGVRAGKAAGMLVAALAHSLPEAELRAAGADLTFDGLAALDQFLGGGSEPRP